MRGPAPAGRAPPRSWAALALGAPRDAWGSKGVPDRAEPLPPSATFRAFFPSCPVLVSEARGVSDRAFKEPLVPPCRRPSPPPSFPFLSGPAHRRGRAMVGGGGRKPLPPPLPKAPQKRSVATGRAGPGEQRGALFSAVVSWPFDLSAARETLLLTCG